MIRNPLFVGLCALAALAAGAPAAQAQTTYTWTGLGADANWATAGNWSGSVVPASDLNNTLIVLAGANRATNTLNLSPGGTFSVNTLTQSSTTAFIVNPAGVNPAVMSIGSGGIVLSNTGGLTINNELFVGTSQTWATNNTGALTVANTGIGEVNVASGVTLTLGGTSTGGITVSAPVTFAGGATLVAASPAGATAVTYTISGAVILPGNLALNTPGVRSLTISGSITPPGSGGSITVNGGGTGIVTLSNAGNAYTGATTIQGGGILATGSIVDGGLTSGIGASTNAAGNLVLNNGTFRFTGAATVTDRLFSVSQNGGTIQANGGGALVFTNTGSIAMTGTGARTFTLAGTSTFANTLTPVISDGAGGATSLVKNEAGYWILAANNTYTGTTTINAGTLQYNNAASIPVAGVVLNGGSFAAGFPIDQAFLGRINNTPPANSSVALGVSSSNNLDFSAANLANVRLGAAPGPFPGTNITYSGTVTPNGTNYRFGNPSGGILLLTQPLTNGAGARGVDLGVGGTVIFGAANTYTGNTTVSAGTLAVNRPATGGTPFGTGAIALSGGGLSFRGAATPVGLTAGSFNRDVIASASDFVSPAPFGVSAGIDSAGGLTGWSLFEGTNLILEFGWPGGVNGVTRPQGLPTGGNVTNAANPLTNYQLAAYGSNGTISNNALFLGANAGITSGTLTLGTAGSFQALSLLVASGNGVATFSARLNFSDGTNTTVSNLTSPDWFNVNPFAIGNLGRMNVATGFLDPTGINNPRLYPIDIALSPTDAAKTLQSITVNYQGGSGGTTTLNVLGLSGVTSGGVSDYSSTYPVTISGNTSIEMLQTQSIRLGKLTMGGNTLTVNGATVSGSGTLSFRNTVDGTGDTSITGNPTYTVNGGTGTNVFAGGVNTVHGGTILDPGQINFNNAARTITKNGVGALQLDFAALNATGTSTLTVNSGIVNINNATAVGTNPNLNVNAQTFNAIVIGSTVNTGPYTGVNNLSVGGGGAGTANLTNVATVSGTLTVSAGTANLPAATSVVGAATISGGTTNFTVKPTFSNNVTVSGGATNLPAGATVNQQLIVNGGTVNVGAASSAAQFLSNGALPTGNVVLNNGSVMTIGGANADNTFASSITGNGSIFKTGSGTQTFAAPAASNNTYSGGTTVDGGKLVSTRAGNLGTGTVTLRNGTTLAIGGTPGTSGTSGFGGNGAGWTLNGGATVAADVLTLTTAANNLTRSAFFNTKQPTNSFTAHFDYIRTGGSGNPADGFAFVIQNQAATALGGGGGALGYNGITTPNAAVLGNIYNPNGRGIAFRTNGATGGYTATGAVDIFNSGGTPGTATGPVSFDLTYDGTAQTLAIVLTQGPNTFALPTQTLNLGAVGAAGAGGGTVWVGFTGATGGENANQQIANFLFNLTGVTPPPLSTYTNNVVVADAASTTIAPRVVTGVTTFTMGNLSMGSAATLTVQPDTGSLADSPYSLNLGATTLTGPATFNVLNNGAGGGVLALGALADGGAARTVTKTGPGTLSLGAAATSLVNGTQVNVTGGTLRVTNATALGTLAAVDLAAATNLSLGSGTTLGAVTGTGDVVLNGNTLTVGSTNNLSSTFGGVIANGSTPGAVTKGGTGTLTLTGASTYTGGTTVAAGTLRIGAGGTTGSITGNVTNNGTLAFNRSDAHTFGGVVSGTGNVTQVGAGTTVLTGANTYSGPTAVSAGTLMVNGDQTAATGAVSVAAAATLAGTGTIGGATTLAAGATLNPGASVGTLTVANSVTINGGTGSTWVVEIDGDGSSFPPPVNTPNDRLALTGAANNLNLVADPSNKLTLSVRPFGGYVPPQNAPMSYTIATVDPGASIQSNGLAFAFDPNAYTLETVGFLADPAFQLAVSGNQLVLTFTPVPEPGMVLAVSAAGFGVLALARRRLRSPRAVPA